MTPRLLPIAALLLSGPASAQESPSCAPDRVLVEAAEGWSVFDVEIADDAAERARGLMFRTDLARDEGMLFLFPDVGPRAFWMKNTPLSLDMLFIDPQGRVCGLVERAEPYTLDARRSGCDAAAVLEINGGVAEALGLEVGAEVAHPFFGEGAAAPCPSG